MDYFPGKRIKVIGEKIPKWDEMLKIAVKTQDVSRLGYAGIDMVVDEDKGPLVMETNSRPGLDIQLVTNSSLRTRLERVENIEVPTIERGIEIAKNLFTDKVPGGSESHTRVLPVIENITLIAKGKDNASVTIPVKLDTGAYRTSIDEKLAKELGYEILSKKIMVTSASGAGYRRTVRIKYNLDGKIISSVASVTDRSKLHYKMIVGRKDLKGYLVNPEMDSEEEDLFEEVSDRN